MRTLDLTAAALLIVGGLNWGLVALAEFDLVATLVGLAAVYGASRLPALTRGEAARATA